MPTNPDSTGRSIIIRNVSVPLADIACAALTILYNVNNPRNPGLYEVAVLAVVFIVAGALFVGRAAQLRSRRGRIVGVLTSLVSRNELNPELLAAAVAPSARSSLAPTVAGVPGSRRSTMVPATLAILGIVTMCCPVVGIVFSGIAVALTFRKKSWVRTLSIVALILSLLGSAFFIVMATRGHPAPPRRHGR